MSNRNGRRGGRSNGPSLGLVSAVAAGVIMAGVTGHNNPFHTSQASGRSGGQAAAAVAVPAAGGGGSWAQLLLAAGGWKATGCDLGAIQAWEVAEDSNPAWNNLLDTTLHTADSTPVPGNPDRVQEYPTEREGIDATVATLNNGRYGPILAALQAGNNAQAVADAVAASPWGTEPFTAECAA